MRPFARVLEQTGFPTRFMVEVTEDAFVTKTHFQDEILPILRKIGVGSRSTISAPAIVAVGAGRHHRRRDQDRPLLHHRHPQAPRSQGILRAIESLSEALGMTVVAEGIETHEELAYLQAATRIRYAQGYYFSKPIFLEDLKLATPRASELPSRPCQPSGAGKPLRERARRRLSPLMRRRAATPR